MAKTRKIRYVGPSPSVSLTLSEAPDLVFVHGASVTVSADLAERLLEQDTFEAVTAGRPGKDADGD